MIEAVAPYFTIGALILSTISLVLSLFSLRRQTIPDEYEVQRRIYELIEREDRSRKFETRDVEFDIAYISVFRESGFSSPGGILNWIKEMWTGELQGKTAVGVGISWGGSFDEDFNGEETYSSEVFGPVTVNIGGANQTSQLREVTFPSATADEVHSNLRWLCYDKFPDRIK